MSWEIRVAVEAGVAPTGEEASATPATISERQTISPIRPHTLHPVLFDAKNILTSQIGIAHVATNIIGAGERLHRYNFAMTLTRSAAKPMPIEVHGSPRHPLGMSTTRFLRDYWQKRPLLVRQAFADFQPPIQPDDLAGLACEEGVLSRLILRDRKRDRWSVKTGPLDEADFASTPAQDWTLLVQDVDKWDVDVADLLESFAFLPSWRIDDVMISYAEPGGGVGAHVDQYDVFLLQGLGQRHWEISNDPNAPLDFRPDVELKQLRQFVPTHEWLLEPGDMLYLPPGVPHDGEAVGGPCMTFSIGMRAPSCAELTGDLADYLAERLTDEMRYTDPDLQPAHAVGEIDAAALQRVRASLPIAATLDDASLRDWFGRFITRYRSARVPAPADKPLSERQLVSFLESGGELVRHPWARSAWSADKTGCTLFVSGQAYPADKPLAERICAQRVLRWSNAPSIAERALLLALIADGHLVAHKKRRARNQHESA